MIDLAARALDVVSVLAVAGLFAAVAHLALDVIREASILDDPTWPETPGARNDRTRLLDEGQVR